MIFGLFRINDALFDIEKAQTTTPVPLACGETKSMYIEEIGEYRNVTRECD